MISDIYEPHVHHPFTWAMPLLHLAHLASRVTDSLQEHTSCTDWRAVDLSPNSGNDECRSSTSQPALAVALKCRFVQQRQDHLRQRTLNGDGSSAQKNAVDE